MNSQLTNDDHSPRSGSIRKRLLEQRPWVAFLLPLIVFSLVGTLEVTERSGSTFFGLIRYDYYPVVYTVKILLTTLTLIFVCPAYRLFPLRVSSLAVGVGMVGVVISRALDGGDARFGQTAQGLHQSGKGFGVGQAFGLGIIGRPLDPVKVGTGREAFSRRRQDNHADRRIAVQGFQFAGKKLDQMVIEGIVDVRPVQGHGGPPVGCGIDYQGFFAHRVTS